VKESIANEGNPLPAVDAFVSITVWNQRGKKYMTAKLQFETRKFDEPTRRGIFCFRRKGAIIGSGAIYNSTIRNAIIEMRAATREPTTVGLSH
jgi:hypothetical protein